MIEEKDVNKKTLGSIRQDLDKLNNKQKRIKILKRI